MFVRGLGRGERELAGCASAPPPWRSRRRRAGPLQAAAVLRPDRGDPLGVVDEGVAVPLPGVAADRQVHVGNLAAPRHTDGERQVRGCPRSGMPCGRMLAMTPLRNWRTEVRRPVAAVIGGVSWNQVIDVPRLPAGRTETLFSTGSREGIGATGSGKALNLARLGFDTRSACAGRRRPRGRPGRRRARRSRRRPAPGGTTRPAPSGTSTSWTPRAGAPACTSTAARRTRHRPRGRPGHVLRGRRLRVGEPRQLRQAGTARAGGARHTGLGGRPRLGRRRTTSTATSSTPPASSSSPTRPSRTPWASPRTWSRAASSSS